MKISFDPHPTTLIFEKFKIPKTFVALKIGRSYPYITQILSGKQRASDEINKRLEKLAKEVEESATNGNLEYD